ncbi:Peptidoglycan/LPS O-acetylase OafA/YrhL, contains acyltransferase and SGNH-hydrolase domains [Sanguibacter gelidistatuariae]|uniref:Peptidoglycan/LPS O-acetylase OafA/YrhL, contains acyltransferase and SGNH-hydrolase domains n=1 Tax=Sanguibacter gelidistatuariae TaxID=1814289 RepID=A0A1G6RXP7_9MICO|nr:acyltransferase family protein [Sanguibacter gelidistatuariae]SDD09348.1 Peptidoglycan/LPS O-acetylase OafA/YrhL, contains acyltransferase and SGNH-hydrolase domains [Sanguibacter gelidistatuariae]
MTSGSSSHPAAAARQTARPGLAVTTGSVGTVRKPSVPRAASSRPPRIHGLDSLRALAVLAVVTYHLAPGLLPGGFVGVDVFFVLSGFLITTLLVRERVQTGRVSLRRFWTRRARRLLPAMVTVVVACTATAGLLGGDVLVGIRSQVMGALTFASNWVYIAQGASYSSDLSPQLFANFWSLAVEEQFYLFWPLVLLAVFTIRRSRTAGLVVTGTFAVASAVWMAVRYDPLFDPSRVYFGTDTHLFGLMAGAFFALWFAPRSPLVRDVAGAAEVLDDAPRAERTGARWTAPLARLFAVPARRRGARLALGAASAVGLVWLSFTLSVDAPSAYRGGLVLASLFTVGLIAFVVRSQPLTRRCEVAPLRWVGVRSYGLYLWHWPLLVLVSQVMGADHPGHGSPWLVVAVTLALTVAAAWASYRFIERPVMVRGIGTLLRTAWDRVRRMALVAWAERRSPARTARGRVRLAVAIAGTLLVVSSVTAAFVRAPEVSELEAEIERGAQAAADGQTSAPVTVPTAPAADPTVPTGATPDAPPSAPAVTEPAPPTAGVAAAPAGDQVTVIGDSVTLISAASLQAALPGVYIDAEVSRQMSTAPEVAAALSAGGALRPYVVLSLGTNSTVNERVMDAAIAAIGPDRTIVLVTGYGDRPWIGPTNDQMRSAAARFPNVVVADWQTTIAAHPESLGKDGVHPQASGQELYAQMLVAGLAQAQAHRSGQ